MLPTVALVDLYDLATVTNADAGIDDDFRVTSITHEIRAVPNAARPVEWTVTLGFDTPDGAAPPQVVPKP